MIFLWRRSACVLTLPPAVCSLFIFLNRFWLFFWSKRRCCWSITRTVVARGENISRRAGLVGAVTVPRVGERLLFKSCNSNWHLCRAGTRIEYCCRLRRPAQSGLCGLLCDRRISMGGFWVAASERLYCRGFFPLSANWFFVFLLLSIVVGALTGALLGLPVLRVRGDYLAVVTLGFAEVVRALVNNLDKPINLTNGPRGISPISKPPLFSDWCSFFRSADFGTPSSIRCIFTFSCC